MPMMITTKPYDWAYATTYANSSDDAGSGNARTMDTCRALQFPVLNSHPWALTPISDCVTRLYNGASHLLVCIVCQPCHSLLLQNKPDCNGA